MSDRTPIAVVFYSLQPEHVGDVVALLAEHDLGPDFGQARPEPEDATTIYLGETYGDFEVTCGSSDAIVARLREIAPNETWYVCEDGYAEWLADVSINTPDLGLYSHTADNSGQFAFTADEIILWASDVDSLHAKLGEPWVKAHRAAVAAIDPRAYVPVVASAS